MQNYEMVRVLGQGQYGTAHLCRDKRNGGLFCMKKITMTTNQAENDAALHEARVLAKMQHPNIIAYRESFLADNALCIVTTFCEEGDLFNLIRKRKQSGEFFKENEVMDLFLQIAMALQHIHENRILHRDLKTQNIFIANGGIIKLGDFGISKVLERTGEMANTVTGTPYYMAPEICTNQPYTWKSDIWSLGCVLYELCTLQHAFASDNLLSLVYQIVKGTFQPIAQDKYSTELSALVNALLDKEAATRPTLQAIFAQPYVRAHMERFARAQMHCTMRQNSKQRRALADPSHNPYAATADAGSAHGGTGAGTMSALQATNSSTPRTAAERMRLRKLQLAEQRQLELKVATLNVTQDNRAAAQARQRMVQGNLGGAALQQRGPDSPGRGGTVKAGGMPGMGGGTLGGGTMMGSGADTVMYAQTMSRNDGGMGATASGLMGAGTMGGTASGLMGATASRFTGNQTASAITAAGAATGSPYAAPAAPAGDVYGAGGYGATPAPYSGAPGYGTGSLRVDLAGTGGALPPPPAYGLEADLGPGGGVREPPPAAALAGAVPSPSAGAAGGYMGTTNRRSRTGGMRGSMLPATSTLQGLSPGSSPAAFAGGVTGAFTDDDGVMMGTMGGSMRMGTMPRGAAAPASPAAAPAAAPVAAPAAAPAALGSSAFMDDDDVMIGTMKPSAGVAPGSPFLEDQIAPQAGAAGGEDEEYADDFENEYDDDDFEDYDAEDAEQQIDARLEMLKQVKHLGESGELDSANSADMPWKGVQDSVGSSIKNQRLQRMTERCKAQLGEGTFNMVYSYLRDKRKKAPEASSSEVNSELIAMVGRSKLRLCFDVDQLVFQELHYVA